MYIVIREGTMSYKDELIQRKYEEYRLLELQIANLEAIVDDESVDWDWLADDGECYADKWDRLTEEYHELEDEIRDLEAADDWELKYDLDC
jgi:hypothetical protein